MTNDMDDIGMVSEGQGTATADERGFTLALLLITMALMAIAWSVALPVWRTAAQREREEELLFRARQYARGVMLFQRKTPGVFPPSVDAMLERKVLRRKYRDPMWPGGEFLIVRAGQVVPGDVPPGLPTPGGGFGGGTSPIPSRPPTTPPSGAPDGDAGQDARPGQSGTPRQPGPFGGIGAREEVGIDAKIVPGGIAGVVSRSKAESIKEYKGKRHYNEWIVTIQDVLPRAPGQQQPQQGPGPQRPGPTAPTSPTSPTSPTLPRS